MTVARRLVGYKLPLAFRRVVCVGLICVATVALLASCNDEPVPAATTQPTNTPTPLSVSTPPPVTLTSTPTATATPTPTPEPTTTPGTLTSPQIFDKVSPSIAFIETATGTGSGVLIDGGYVATNAHVVWPYDTARIVFPDGSEFDEVQVKGWDLLADLAVLGPIDAPTDTLALVDGESLPIGTAMFLIGYPGEVEEFPSANNRTGTAISCPRGGIS